ncbi:UNVERIFIED_ASMBLY: VRR-NUC domain-containing protein [Shigella phage 2019SD1]|uniref:VRR-NUC domain-containing protein n=1 Tax=Shigella phage 2019SD1 TaxID=2848074 RepID=A0A6M5CAP2_9CAUD|nr:VRR-NUC domain-containing protein [Shigella phage 2019SD1]
MAMTDKGDYLEFYERDPTDTLKEESHQIGAFQWLTYAHPEFLAGIRKRGRQGIATAMMDQQAGLVKGVSDFIILIGLKAVIRSRQAMTDKGDYLEFYERDPTDTLKEESHQIGAFQWLTYAHPEFLAGIRKRGRQGIATAMMDQQAGLVKGVSDFIILIGLKAVIRSRQ